MLVLLKRKHVRHVLSNCLVLMFLLK